MALTQQERNRKSRDKLGIKQKLFALDTDTIALLERIAQQTGQSQTQVFKNALAVYAQSIEGN
ncbi:MAG: ribbon-helix-helix protein, CopG family [Alysiella sp.]|uniref:ribbon-helix-helix protein, CopG family n=1 Tax=Alysiella sp. TaxID=1872483 RepID=UPI0026DB9CFC|nr:ribbon-helix-helix protein, CopG family [Alysiella sp.]MDO4434382.1 ribbon-helix-helix protein, CopG family [Alysiella sp.]